MYRLESDLTGECQQRYQAFCTLSKEEFDELYPLKPDPLPTITRKSHKGSQNKADKYAALCDVAEDLRGTYPTLADLCRHAGLFFRYYIQLNKAERANLAEIAGVDPLAYVNPSEYKKLQRQKAHERCLAIARQRKESGQDLNLMAISTAAGQHYTYLASPSSSKVRAQIETIFSS